MFVFPFVAIFLVFWVYPLLSSFGMSFQHVTLGQEAEWTGMDNYQKLMGDGVFLKSIGNSALYMVLTLVILIPFPMLLAVLINNKWMWGREFLSRLSSFLH